MHATAARVAFRYLEAGKHDGSIAIIRQLAAKYARVLGVTELPKIVIRDNLNSTWLGRCTRRNGQQNVMEVQAQVLGDEKTLERIVAHEMAHHVEFLQMTDEDVARELTLRRLRLGPKDHSQLWYALAAKINAVAGAGFVTKDSDASYVKNSEVKPYLLLVVPLDGSRLGFAVGVRPSPKMRAIIDRQVAAGGKLFKLTDAELSAGPPIGKGWRVPREPALQQRLEKLYDTGKI
jgi:hypothetical protein